MGSSAFTTFKVTHGRGKVMVERSAKLAKALHKIPAPPTVEQYNDLEYVSDLGRSGIVTAVAAFDRYFTTKFAECVVPVLRHEGPSEGLLKILSSAGLDLKEALGLLHMDRPHRRIGTLIRQHLSDFTTQRFAVIDELFKSIGVSDLSHHAQNKTKRKTLKLSIEGLIRRRHVIVHEGDVNKRGQLKPLDPYDAIKRIENLRLLVESADEIVSNRMAKCRKSKAAKKAAKKKIAKKGGKKAVKKATRKSTAKAKATSAPSKQGQVLSNVEAALASARNARPTETE